MTFSLLARDPATGELGVATQSHYFGVGAVVTWAEAGAGVVATQAFPGRSYGPRGLALMRQGLGAGEALAQLLAADPDRELRQVGFLDATGGFDVHSGERCVPATGVVTTENAVALGNMLDTEAVLDAMVVGFAQADGDLAHRLVAGLRSGERAGGDIRGRQSAALLIVDGPATGTPWEGARRDLRVDDHPDPIGELSRLVHLDDAFKQMSQVVFDPAGPLLGQPGSASEFAVTADTLADVDAVLDHNAEAVFWSAVLHARWGHSTAAQHLLERAARRNPRLPRLIRRLADAGLLTSDAVAHLAPGSR